MSPPVRKTVPPFQPPEKSRIIVETQGVPGLNYLIYIKCLLLITKDKSTYVYYTPIVMGTQSKKLIYYVGESKCLCMCTYLPI